VPRAAVVVADERLSHREYIQYGRALRRPSTISASLSENPPTPGIKVTRARACQSYLSDHRCSTRPVIVAIVPTR
jgi:hypothetical protein